MSRENEPLEVRINGDWRTSDEDDLWKIIGLTAWSAALTGKEIQRLANGADPLTVQSEHIAKR